MNGKTNAAPVAEKQDPAPDPMDLAENHLSQTISNITNHGKDQLRQMRDQLDELMRGLDTSHASVAEVCQDHTRKVVTVIQTKVVMAEAIEAMLKEFSPRPARVLTQEKTQTQ